jgi:hypothetical protein
MGTRRLAPKARRGRSHKAQSQGRDGARIPEALHEAIENERSNLSRAESVLGCLAISMEYENDSVRGPYYPDVAQLARELVRQSINGLDSLVLQRHLLGNKVKESHPLPYIQGAYPAASDCICLSSGAFIYGAARKVHIGIRTRSIAAPSKSPLGPTLH